MVYNSALGKFNCPDVDLTINRFGVRYVSFRLKLFKNGALVDWFSPPFYFGYCPLDWPRSYNPANDDPA